MPPRPLYYDSKKKQIGEISYDSASSCLRPTKAANKFFVSVRARARETKNRN